MKKTKKTGFTIVELVIVIAVIGILSAVLIPTFSGLVTKANETALQESLRNAYTEYASNYSYSPENPQLYSRENIYFSKNELSENADSYTIPVSSEGNEVYYFSIENGKYVTVESETPSSNYLGQFNGFYAYVVE